MLLVHCYKFWLSSSKWRFTPLDSIPPEVFEERDEWVIAIMRWEQAFANFVGTLAPEPPGHPLSQLRSLRIHLIALLIRLVTSLNAPTTAADKLLAQFRCLVNHCQAFLVYERRKPQIDAEGEYERDPMGNSTFTFDLRTTSHLFFTVTRCRNYRLRHHALNLLLSSPRREAMWDSFLAAKVGGWIVGIEEEGMDDNWYIPEESRVWGESLEVDYQRRVVKVSCRCWEDFEKGVWKYRKEELNW